MIMKNIHYYLFLGLILSMIAGCSAAPPAQQEPAQSEAVTTAAQQPEPPKEIVREPESPAKKPAAPTKPKEAPKPAASAKQAEAAKPETPIKQETPAKKPEPSARPEPAAEKKEPVVEDKQKAPSKKEDIIAEFEGVTITKETYEQTKADVEKIVDQLNRITATKDYTQWLTFLSSEYKRQYSQASTLKIVSEALPVKGIKLQSLKDYFTYVFVPSRQNVRVDDIKFVSASHVDIIMKQGSSALLIYKIENTSGEWKLVPPKL